MGIVVEYRKLEGKFVIRVPFSPLLRLLPEDAKFVVAELQARIREIEETEFPGPKLNQSEKPASSK